MSRAIERVRASSHRITAWAASRTAPSCRASCPARWWSPAATAPGGSLTPSAGPRGAALPPFRRLRRLRRAARLGRLRGRAGRQGSSAARWRPGDRRARSARVLTSPPDAAAAPASRGGGPRAGALLGLPRPRLGHGRRQPRTARSCRPRSWRCAPRSWTLVRLAASRSREMALTVTDSPDGRRRGGRGRARRSTRDLRRPRRRLGRGAGVARLTWDGETGRPARRAAGSRMGRARVVPPPGAFLQATREGEAALRRPRAGGGRGAPAASLDLFAGVGHLRPAARRDGRGPRRRGRGRAMIAGAAGGLARRRRASTASRPRRATCSAARSSPRSCAGFDAVVHRPAPRRGRGAGRGAGRARGCRWWPTSPATRSPSPATPRSSSRRATRMDPVTVVDQFRWSTHVELAPRFSPRPEAPQAPTSRGARSGLDRSRCATRSRTAADRARRQ